MKLVLIDANNLAIRHAFAHQLSVQLAAKSDHPDDFNDPRDSFPTGVFHGFFKSLIMLRQRFPERYFAIVWDGGSRFRIELTRGYVAQGILPEEYKGNRRRQPPKEPILNFLKQKPDLLRAISCTNIPQQIVKDEEADDVIASYVAKYKNQVESILLVTDDKDYFQLLDGNVNIFRRDELYTRNDFRAVFGLEPDKWVEIGALMGETGETKDNIFAIPGWGIETAKEWIQTHKTAEAVLTFLHGRWDNLRVQYPDLSGEAFQALAKLETPAKKPKYTFLHEKMPFTGVAWALEKKQVKIPKSELLALMHEEKMPIAKVLKTMRIFDVPTLPGVDAPPWNRQLQSKFVSFCRHYQLNEIEMDAEMICAPQPVLESVSA